jgi:hypothetical protein
VDRHHRTGFDQVDLTALQRRQRGRQSRVQPGSKVQPNRSTIPRQPQRRSNFISAELTHHIVRITTRPQLREPRQRPHLQGLRRSYPPLRRNNHIQHTIRTQHLNRRIGHTL